MIEQKSFFYFFFGGGGGGGLGWVEKYIFFSEEFLVIL